MKASPKGILMEHRSHDFGSIHPKAPSDLSRFAFLLGRWECEAKLTLPDGSSQVFQARWTGRYILDGYVIADEYRMTDPTGKLIVLGTNFRSYDATNHTWQIKWLNALSGTWTDLVSEEFGGITITDRAISYSFKEPVAAWAYTRATYTIISVDHFTWLGEKSDDGKSWTNFMTVTCQRSQSQ